MPSNTLLTVLLSGKAPAKVRSAIARNLAPLSPEEILRALVFLINDPDRSIAAEAKKTISELKEEEIALQLKSHACDPKVLEYFGVTSDSDLCLQSILANPSTPGRLVESIVLTLTPELLAIVLDNKVRILNYPGILTNIKSNPLASQDIQRQVREIETEFLGNKKRDYSLSKKQEEIRDISPIPELEFEFFDESISLEGLPIDEEARKKAVENKLTELSFREKIRYALFGNRQVRSLLIRDSNREVSRMVLRSPKITESEIESISSMRGIGEDILRDIGNSRDFIKSYNVVHNLIKNPKTPPTISQRLIFRLRPHDLSMLTRDREIPEAVRFHATRMVNQRTRKGSK